MPNGSSGAGLNIAIGDLLTGARFAVARLRELGVAIPPGNRLDRARAKVDRLLREAQEGEEGGEVVVDTVRFGEMLRTLLEHYLIVRSIDEDDPREVQHVASILSGSDAPVDDASSRSRDAQFELLVATVLRLGGVVGVHLGEPDLRIPAGAETLGVAVKRLSSAKQLTKRVKKAVAQIRGQGQRGLVVVGLDALVEAQSVDIASTESARLTAECRRVLRDYRYEEDVVGVLGLATRFLPVVSVEGVVIGIHIDAHLELVAPLEEAGPIRLRLALIGRNVMRSIGRELAHLPERA